MQNTLLCTAAQIQRTSSQNTKSLLVCCQSIFILSSTAGNTKNAFKSQEIRRISMIFCSGQGLPLSSALSASFLQRRVVHQGRNVLALSAAFHSPPPPPHPLLFRTTVKFSRTSQKSAAGIDGELSGVFVVSNQRHLLAEFSRRVTQRLCQRSEQLQSEGSSRIYFPNKTFKRTLNFNTTKKCIMHTVFAKPKLVNKRQKKLVLYL
jgi:hypothetical protein